MRSFPTIVPACIRLLQVYRAWRATAHCNLQAGFTACVYRSSIGEVWGQHVKQAGMKLKQNAYVHWYERQGCAREDLVQAVHLMHDAALAYEWCFR